MRKILFRGKTVKEQWAYGLLAHIGNAWYISNKAGVATAYEVIPSTVGQYTGLKDKNGTKIFEGDILKYKLYVNGEITDDKMAVSYCEYTAGYSPFSSAYSCDGCCCGVAIEETEVIGNIHDNPELLNAED